MHHTDPAGAELQTAVGQLFLLLLEVAAAPLPRHARVVHQGQAKEAAQALALPTAAAES